jgi:hypothetical protein
MNKINFGRVLIGGLLAGVVLNIGEYLVNEVVLAEQMMEVFRRLNLPRPGGNFIVVAVILTFILGIVMVLVYAMIRPRFGPGVRTAVLVGLVAWFFVCFYCGVIYGLLLRVPTNLIVIGMIWCLVEYVLAAIAGAWAYKEA